MGNFENENKALFDAMVAYKPDGIMKAVDAALEAGMDPTAIINAMGDGMTEVGNRFQRGKLFLPHVMSAANGMTAAVEKLKPMMLKSGENFEEKKKKAVMGTVEGDVHDIGKSICSTMLQCSGFEIVDLGRDVPKQNFVDACVNDGCHFCGMSALMTTTMTVMKDVIGMLKDAGVRDDVVVMVGGAPITQDYCNKIGADIYGETANETVSRVKDL